MASHANPEPPHPAGGVLRRGLNPDLALREIDRVARSGEPALLADTPAMIWLLSEVPLDPTMHETAIRREPQLEGVPGSPPGQAIVSAAAKHVAD